MDLKALRERFKGGFSTEPLTLTEIWEKNEPLGVSAVECFRAWINSHKEHSKGKPIHTKCFFDSKKCEFILVHKQGTVYRRETKDGIVYDGIMACHPLLEIEGRRFHLIDEYEDYQDPQ